MALVQITNEGVKADLDYVKGLLEQKLGFKLSYTDVVAHLIKEHLQEKP